MTKTCYQCGKGTLHAKKVRYLQHGVDLGEFPAEVCTVCGEQFFSGPVFDKIEDAARCRGVWGLANMTRVGQSGNNLDIRISNQLAEFMGLTKGREVFIRPEGKKRLVVELMG